MFRFGISTACLYPCEVLDSVQAITDTGVGVIEVFYNSLNEADNATIEKINEAVKKSDSEIISYHPFTSLIEGLLFFSGYKKRINDGLELYKRYFETARKIGAKIFVFHGEKDHSTFGQTQICEDDAFEVYEKLCLAAKNEGILFTQENVASFRSQNASFLLHLREAMGDKIGFTFDIKQAYRARRDPYEILDAMGERISHFHVNDFSTTDECCLPMRGDADYKRLFAKLLQYNYSGNFVLEVYRKNFGEITDLVNSIKALNQSFPIEKSFVAERFEENFAVLEDDSQKYCNIKKNELCDGISEGDFVINKNGVFTPQYDKTVKIKAEVEEKIKKLFS